MKTDEIEAIEKAVEIIKAIGDSRISKQFNTAIDKLMSATKAYAPAKTDDLPVLQLMTVPASSGFEHFDLLYRAAKEKIPVSFIHFSYQKRKFKHCIVHPFLIKEFDNRWYLIGFSESHQMIRTFGVDRISFPLLLKMKFIPTSLELKEFFYKDMYGVFPLENTVKTTIIIHAKKQSTHFFKAYPIHESQVITKFSSGHSKITFELIPTTELARHFRMQGDEVQVIRPRWFADYVHSNRPLLK
jgi:predicted DNA-binding transcriptional regulator YafY